MSPRQPINIRLGQKVVKVTGHEMKKKLIEGDRVAGVGLYHYWVLILYWIDEAVGMRRERERERNLYGWTYYSVKRHYH